MTHFCRAEHSLSGPSRGAALLRIARISLSVVTFVSLITLVLGFLLPTSVLFSQASFPGRSSPEGDGSAAETLGLKMGGSGCPPPCANTARASRVTAAEVVKSELVLECASIHFGGFIPGYGGLELFGIGQGRCPAVETYIPAHYGAVAAPCRECVWRDGATIRERENSCSQELNFVFFAMPNCERGVWVNTSERVRTCAGESTCHRKAGDVGRPGKERS